MNWDQMRRQYYRTDGTFRDVYATGMDDLAWENFFKLMEGQSLTFHTSEEGKAAESASINPHTVERQWELQEYVPAARVQLSGGVRIKFYFFDRTELEGTVDPRDVKNEARHRELKSFLGKIADATGKTVKFAQENNREKTLYQLTPRPPKADPKPKAEAEAPAEAPADETPAE